MNKIKHIGILFIVGGLLTPQLVRGYQDPYKDWKTGSILTPTAGSLKGAGQIDVSFKGLKNADSYDLYVDGTKQKTVKSQDDVVKTSIYTVKTMVHDLKVVANVNDKEITSYTRYFKTSKKGIGVNDRNLKATVQDFNQSWYYNWSTTPSTHVKDKEYVPMIWNESSINWLSSSEKDNYSTVLGFNEPDNSYQSNMTSEKAASYQKYFTESSLRIGAPATTYSPSNNQWFDEYIKNINMDEIDFIPVHIYYDWASSDMANVILDEIDKTYQKYNKPIWITEYGCANRNDNKFFGVNDTYDITSNLRDYMTDTIKGFESRDYVERYAWFSFNENDTEGGKTALYKEADGTLTSLGKLYKSLGNVDDSNVDYSDQSNGSDTLEFDDTSLPIEQEETNLNLLLNATQNTLNWSSSDNKIATVNNGILTPLKEGTVTITVSDGTQETSIKVTIKNEAIHLSNSHLTLSINETKQLTVDTDKEVTWSSSDSSIVSVKNGLVTAHKAGTAIITVSTENKKETCTITVKEEPLKVENMTLKVGQEATININTTFDRIRTEDTDIIDLQNTKVKALQPGCAIVSIYKGSQKVNCIITVTGDKAPVLNKKSLNLQVGDQYILKVSNSKNYSFKASNSNVIVTNSGLVTAKSVGTSTITVTNNDGLKDTCTITVSKKVQETTKDYKKIILKPSTSYILDDYYKSTNTSIVKVSGKKITGVKSGTCDLVNDKYTIHVIVPYKITYHLNGGKNTKDNPTYYYDTTVTLKNITRKGYKFKGWYSDKKCTKKVTKLTGGHYNLYAKWSKK